MKCRRIDRAKAQGKVHRGQTADAVVARCFLKCSGSGYILDLVVQSSARGQLKGQRVADKRNDQESCVGGEPVMACLQASSGDVRVSRATGFLIMQLGCLLCQKRFGDHQDSGSFRWERNSCSTWSWSLTTHLIRLLKLGRQKVA